MSDYDFRHNYDQRGARAMGYGQDDSGSGVWTVIGLLAVLALLGLIVFGAATGSGDGAATDSAAPAAATTPAVDE